MCALTLQAYATYSFTFDWVYGPDSFQSEVYDKSAKGTVLSTLQACPSLGTHFKALRAHMDAYIIAMGLPML